MARNILDADDCGLDLRESFENIVTNSLDHTKRYLVKCCSNNNASVDIPKTNYKFDLKGDQVFSQLAILNV